MKSNRKKRTNEGITLIALVITIIVLLILAGVSIATLFGENGILTKATSAKEATEIGQEQEFVDLATTSAMQNSITERGNAKFTQEELESELDKLTGGDDTDVTTKGSNYLVTFKDSKREYEVEIPNWSSADLDWSQILEDAKDDDSIQGIGTDGEPVDMSLWQYTEIEGGVGLFGGTEEKCSWSENGYLGECPDGNIIGCVPQYIRVNGEFKPVVSMESTFKGNAELVNLPEIPSTVTNIDSMCHNCENLKTVTIYSNIEKIGDYAFANCINLQDLAIAKGVKVVGTRAFQGCQKLSNINLPETIQILDHECFSNCTALSDIYLPEGIREMAESFLGCTGLTSIEIPTTLEKITSPDNENASEEYIGPFGECPNLKTLAFREGIKDLSNLTKIVIRADIENIKIPGTVERIPSGFNRSNLKSVEIGEGVKIIGNSAFSGCEQLTNMNSPNSVTKIEDSAFSNCTGMVNINLPDSIEEIGERAFYGSTGLKNITIPKSMSKIGDSAFYNCTELQSVNILDNVKEIGMLAFYDCEKLNSVTIANSVTTIQWLAFGNCNQLKSITIPSSVIEMGERVFDNNLETIIIESESTLQVPSNKWGAENATIVKK